MILTKKAFIHGINKPLSIRLRAYKKARTPKHCKPLNIYTSLVYCYGELLEN